MGGGQAASVEEKRKKLLKQLLDDKNFRWRSIDTLSRVIGLSTEDTKKLLIEIDARGSTAGNDVWGLISRNPLNIEKE